RPGGREFGVRGRGEVLGGRRGAGQDAFGGTGPPGPGGDRAEGEAGVAHDSARDVEGGGDRADREGVRGPFAHLAVARTGGDPGGRQRDVGEERAGRQRGLPV